MFSVIIPAHERGRALAHTLEGVCVAAGRSAVEVIVVDNHSVAEKPAQIVQMFTHRIAIRLVEQDPGAPAFSLCRARNMAAQLARYPYVVLLDSDCIPNAGFFAAAKAAVRDDRLLVGERRFIRETDVCQEAIACSNHLENLPRVRSVSNYGLSADRRLPMLRMLPGVPHPWAYCHGANLVAPTHLVRKVAFDESYDGCWGYEDIDFAYRAVTTEKLDVNFVLNMFVYHQEHPGEDPLLPQRLDKQNNPNWRRICSTIPGFEAHKRREYRAVAGAQEDSPATATGP